MERAKFKSAKKDLDIEKLKNGANIHWKKSLEPKPSFTGKRLGSYKNQDVILLKKGKYGLYIVCGR